MIWGAKQEDIYSDANHLFRSKSGEKWFFVESFHRTFQFPCFAKGYAKRLYRCPTVKREIPIERLEVYNPNRAVDCKEAIMVIGFFTSKEPTNKNPEEIE